MKIFKILWKIYELDYKTVTLLVSTIIPEMVSRFRHIEAINTANFIELPKFMGSRGQRTLPSTMSTD